MTTIKWGGTIDFDPALDANWQGGVKPTGADDAVVDGTASGPLFLSTGKTITCLSFTSSSGLMRLEGGTLAVGVGGMVWTAAPGDIGSFGSPTAINCAGDSSISGGNWYSEDVGGLDVNVVGTNVATGTSFHGCDFSHGTDLTATDCTDGGDNTGITFVASAAGATAASVALNALGVVGSAHGIGRPLGSTPRARPAPRPGFNPR
jgi:hypothetical protein